MYLKSSKFRLQTFLLCFCMIIQIFPPIQVWATESVNANSAIPENELEVVSVLEDTSTTILSAEELQDLVQDTLYYSHLTANERMQVCDEYFVNDRIMIECETAGYSLLESIELAKVFQNVDITPEHFEEMVINFGDRELALQQAKKFANYRYTHASANMGQDPVCVGYLVSGIYAGDILKARAMAALMETNIAEIALFNGEVTDYGEDELGDIAYMFNTKRETIDAYILQNNLSAEEFIEGALENLGDVLVEAGDYPSTLSDEEEAYFDPTLYPTAPFVFKQNKTEIINNQTGGVGYQETEAVLPGKNGLDLNIGIRYSTDTSSVVNIYVKKLGISEDPLAYNRITRKQMYSPLNLFAPGWEFTSSYIHYYKKVFDDVYSSFVSSDGSVRAIYSRDVDDADREDVRLYNGKLEIYDVRLYKDSSYTDNNVTSLFCAKYKDGKKEYFDAQGKLMKTENRYGDKITYRYYVTGTELDYFKQHYNKVEITDTLNQLTTIEKTALITEYDKEGNEVHIQPMIVTLPDQSVITYRLRGIQHYKNTNETDFVQVLESKTNQEGLTTSFEYIDDDVSEFSFIPSFSADYGEQAYYIMTAINHPTGLRTEYTYEKAKGSLCSWSDTWDRYCLIKRIESDGVKECNKETYSYSTDFSTSTTDEIVYCTNSDGLITESIYTRCTMGSDRARVKSSERVYYMDGDKEVNVSKTEYDDYYERTYPTTITKYLYNPDGTQYLCTVEKYEYNEYGDCIKYWDAQAEGNTEDTEHLTTYAYDSEYHYLTERTHKTDQSTTMREVYTPSEDHMNIIAKSSYMNDVLIAKTDFSYGENSSLPSAQVVHRSNTAGDTVTTTYEYLNNTFLSKETVNQNSIEYTYDIYGNTLSKKDANGNIISYTYDKLSRPTNVNYPDGTTESTVYQLKDESGNIVNRVTTTAQNGAKTEYNYDLLGRIYQVKDLTRNVVNMTYEYDSMGKCIKETNALGNYATYDYDVSGRKIATRVYDAAGNLCSQETCLYENAFDAETSKVTTTTGINENIIKTATYTDKYGNTVRKDAGDTGKLSESKRYVYNYVGDAVKEIFRTTENGEDQVRTSTTVTSIADVGTLSTVTDYYGNETKTYKNMAGQEVDAVDGNGNHAYYSYDASGRLMSKSVALENDFSITTYTYDGNGNIIQESITDGIPGEGGSQRHVYRAYDSMNRLVKEWNDEEGETHYAYDSLGNVVSMTIGITQTDTEGQTTTYEYDSRGHLIKTTDPMGQSENRTYDNADNLHSVTDRNGVVTTYTYDACQRPVRSSLQQDANTAVTQWSYFVNELPLTLSQGNEVIAYTYNTKGQVTQEQTTGTVTSTKNYTYDADGNVSRLQITENAVVYDQSYMYNPKGQLIQVTDNLKNQTLASYTYDGAGNINSETLANGIITTYTYNTANAIASVVNQRGTTTVSAYYYDYYLDGNRKSERDYNLQSRSFVYDKAGRLVGENELQSNVLTNTTYTYDRFGNRSSMQVSGADSSQTTYTYDSNNRLTKLQKTDTVNTEEIYYTYDNNGNTLSQSRATLSDSSASGSALELLSYLQTESAETVDDAEVICYAYDVYNRLSTVTTDKGLNASYAYNALNHRIQKTVNGVDTDFIWDGSTLVRENGEQTLNYSYGLGLIEMTIGNTEYYYLSNAHSDITQLTDDSGVVVEDYLYDAFGNLQNDTDTYNPFRYSGEYYDTETDMIYLRNRYYNPNVGRFITEDPVKDGLNWYVYCGNNPVMFVDPLGLKGNVRYVLGDSVRLRSAPGLNSATYNYLEKNTDVLYTGNKTEIIDGHMWAEIQYKSAQGWIAADYLGHEPVGGFIGPPEFVGSMPDKSQKQVDFSNVINFSFELGTGLYFEANVAGVAVEMGGKRYYDLTNAFTNNPTESMQFSVMAQATDKVQVGGKVTGMIDPVTKQHLRNEGFFGVKVGNQTFGMNNMPYNKEFLVDFSIGAYVGIGAEVNITVNVSEFLRQIFK